jgi:hypothetical protein
MLLHTMCLNSINYTSYLIYVNTFFWFILVFSQKNPTSRVYMPAGASGVRPLAVETCPQALEGIKRLGLVGKHD